MKQIYTDYIVVNVDNYQVINHRTGKSGWFCNLNLMPIEPSKSLSVDDKKQGIAKYAYTTSLPFRVDKDMLIGGSMLCESEDFKNMKLHCDELINFGFYRRCLNLANILDTYTPISENINDYKIICTISDKLEYLLESRLRTVLRSQENRLLDSLSDGIIAKMSKRINAHEDITQVVKDVMTIDKEYYKEPEYKIIDEKEF